MLGEIISVITALLWATSTITAAKALKSLNPINVNALKTFFAFISMVPFALIMGELSDDEFRHYVNEAKNDFSNWVREVVGRDKLADALAQINDRRDMQIAIFRDVLKR